MVETRLGDARNNKKVLARADEGAAARRWTTKSTDRVSEARGATKPSIIPL
jgi:hypothetical protein